MFGNILFSHLFLENQLLSKAVLSCASSILIHTGLLHEPIIIHTRHDESYTSQIINIQDDESTHESIMIHTS